MAHSQAATLVPTAPAMASSLYRAVWRWHFIAGLLVCPFLILLGVTGGLYLFSEEIDRAVYANWLHVEARGTPPLAKAVLIERVGHAGHGRVLQFVQSSDPASAVRMTLRAPNGEARSAFVDPYDANVLGVTRYGGVMQVVRKLHSLQFFGSYASWLVEAAAGWAIVLVSTGVFLWWPRGRSGGVVTIRGRPRERRFWRDLHAVTGLFAGALVVFLAVTGMPWSDVWGGKVQEWSSAQGLGRPEPPAEVLPAWALDQPVAPSQAASSPPATMHHAQPAEETGVKGPWALEKVPPPQSRPQIDKPMIDADRALAVFASLHLPPPYSVTLPLGPRGAYVATISPADVEGERVLYVDPYDGHVLDDVGFARFGNAAKAIEWGIAVHQGQQYGALNRYLMLAGCIAIVMLVVSALTMWWMRRRPGTLGVPPPPDNSRVTLGLMAIIVPIGLFYPLVGLSLLAALAVEGAVTVFGRVRGHA